MSPRHTTHLGVPLGASCDRLPVPASLFSKTGIFAGGGRIRKSLDDEMLLVVGSDVRRILAVWDLCQVPPVFMVMVEY